MMIKYFDGIEAEFFRKPEEIDILPLYLKHHNIMEDNIIFDLGSFEGIFSVYASLKAKKGKVFSFEPDLRNFGHLTQNLTLNNLNNIFPIPFAIGGSNGKKFLQKRVNENASFLSHLSLHHSKEDLDIQETFSLTLDDFSDFIGLEKIDFIKMDVEGAELEILEGCKKIIEKFHPDFAIASYHILNGKQTRPSVEKFLSDRGYNVETGGFHQTTWGWYDKS